MNNSTTSNPDNNRSIEYIITCSDSTGQEEKFVFHQHTAPSSLCRQFDPSSSSNQIKMEISFLMANLIKTHSNEILQARDWYCVECNQPATTIIHNPMSYLHLSKPQINDMAIPCCANKTCDHSIRKHFAEMMAITGVPNALE